jgi:Arc/MetJ family transcription regulator
MAKHLIDLDEAAVIAARAELGTATLKETVNEALRRTGAQRTQRVAAALDTLAQMPDLDRGDAWR